MKSFRSSTKPNTLPPMTDNIIVLTSDIETLITVPAASYFMSFPKPYVGNTVKKYATLLIP
ncbi:uncharacterized protein EAF01_001720 [Botrytis porri]|uniref:uncharacterized protein n=1 Tax=Botrytis porri TaxID=87229 RepID=UPI00190266B9|nr:uncharacterized protein EAF01_001720 [Botrytis porri]KAF7912699.1 hypothetical protein EAF01_001720 [Botrytis porri]